MVWDAPFGFGLWAALGIGHSDGAAKFSRHKLGEILTTRFRLFAIPVYQTLSGKGGGAVKA